MRYDRYGLNRRSIRLPAYDYSTPGSYFVTIGTHNRECLFGDIVDGEMRLNAYGEIARACWQGIPAHFQNVRLDACVIMPNHMHGIVTLVDDPDVGATHASPLPGASPLHPSVPLMPRGPRPASLGAIVGSFKSAVTRRVNALRETPGAAVWQRNYYEHIVRDDEDLSRIQAYIEDNPLHWDEDEYHP